jgi:hypothetical protein
MRMTIVVPGDPDNPQYDSVVIPNVSVTLVDGDQQVKWRLMAMASAMTHGPFKWEVLLKGHPFDIEDLQDQFPGKVGMRSSPPATP